MNYYSRKQSLKKSPILDKLCQESGRIYTKTLLTFWRTVRRKNIWLKKKSMERIYNSNIIHAHSADATIDSFYNSLSSWRELRKTDPNARPPRKRKFFFPVTWKNTAIRIKNNDLILSNGRGNEPIVFKNWKYDLPQQCMLRWNKLKSNYEMVFTYKQETKQQLEGTKKVGIDLGIIHAVACSNGYIYNGRMLRSLQQWRNKKLATYQQLISSKKKGSRQWKKLIQNKRKFLAMVNHRIDDMLHKITSRLVLTQKSNDVKTLVIGDLNGIRQDNDKGKRANQENHQWMFNKTFWMLKYKSEREGIEIVRETEQYTSKTCPKCLNIKKKQNGRNYICRKCSFRGHRDLVGATNILTKYLGSGKIQVVAEMAPAIHVRYDAHMNVAYDCCVAA